MQTLAKGDWQSILNIYNFFLHQNKDTKRLEEEDRFSIFIDKDSKDYPAGTIINVFEYIYMYELDRPRILSDTFKISFILRFNVNPALVQSEIRVPDKGIKVFNKSGQLFDFSKMPSGDREALKVSMFGVCKNGNSKKEVHV